MTSPQAFEQAMNDYAAQPGELAGGIDRAFAASRTQPVDVAELMEWQRLVVAVCNAGPLQITHDPDLFHRLCGVLLRQIPELDAEMRAAMKPHVMKFGEDIIHTGIDVLFPRAAALETLFE